VIRTVRAGGALLFASMMLALVPSAQALPDGVQRITYMVGPLQITPGQNRISYRPLASEKPAVDGWIVRFKPNLVRPDGIDPPSDQVMFHHGVWLNLSRPDATAPGIPERFVATGEEQTIVSFPEGFGYRYKASDRWLLNHMIHNLTSRAMTLYVSYTIDFIPDSSPAAEGIRPVRPIWMDVENGSGYPVFDVHRGSGTNGRFTFPDDAQNPYPYGDQRNVWTVDRDGVLVATAGHVHTGGLWSDLWLRRGDARRAHLFRSHAKYYEPRGPVSWDMSMKATPPNWRVAVHKGDKLGVSATYETKLASWYESMGIMVVWMADGGGGKNPYRTKVDYPGHVTHGHLPENDHHGGGPSDLPDPRTLQSGVSSSADPFSIAGFTYSAGDLRVPGPNGRPPVVHRGQSLTFELSQQDASQEIWHSLTSCAPPCNRSTGIGYPIPDGKFQFDSGQLGTYTPAVGRLTWATPKNLPVGTYTYFCRIHPSMRGAFRVEP
jgi:hypothetical protein